MQNLGYILRRQDKTQEAEQTLRRALAASTRVLGPDHPNTVQINDNLANVLLDEKHFEEAERLQRENLATRRRVLGEKNPKTFFSMNNLATVLMHENKLDEADALLKDALKKEIEVLGAQHPEIGGVWYYIASVAAYRKNRGQVLSSLHEAIAHGYADAEELSTDDTFAAFRTDAEFQALVSDLRTRAAGVAATP